MDLVVINDQTKYTYMVVSWSSSNKSFIEKEVQLRILRWLRHVSKMADDRPPKNLMVLAKLQIRC